MFSKRIASPHTENQLYRQWEARLRAGLPLIDMVEQNPTRVGLEYPAASILDALRQPGALRYEPDPLGLAQAREVLARDWSARGLAVSVDDLVLTASTSEAYSLLFKLLCDPGDQVLIPQPSYPLFEMLAGLDGVTTRGYQLVYDGAWSIDLDSVRAALDARTRAIVVVSPNNPTGSFLKRTELEALAELGVPLIVDEVFWPYPFAADASRTRSALESNAGLVFVLDGLSKRAALPQLKLGWITVGGDSRVKRDALCRLELANDAYLSAGSAVMHALGQLLEVTEPLQRAILARLQHNLHGLRQRLAGSAVSALHVEGGWYACLRLPETRSEQAWASALADAGIRVHPGWFYDFASGAHVVLSLLVEPGAFERGLQRVVEVVEAGL